MSVFSDRLDAGVRGILTQPWSTRNGLVVPTTESVALSGGGVNLEATVLYADLAQSTHLATNFQNRTAAKIIKSFIYCVCRIITREDGTVTSFDGDRVMGIFIGDSKNSDAARAALRINWAVQKVVKPRAEAHFSSLSDGAFGVEHAVGIDTGHIFAVRAGQRGDNDLIWIGRAPNVAAKLSDLREAPHRSFIHADVYSKLNEKSKYATGTDMWQSRSFEIKATGQKIPLYRSSYWWEP